MEQSYTFRMLPFEISENSTILMISRNYLLPKGSQGKFRDRNKCSDSLKILSLMRKTPSAQRTKWSK